MNQQAARAIAVEPEPRTSVRAPSAWLRTPGERDGGKRGAAALLLAAAAHVGMVMLALQQDPPPPVLTAVTEVELQPPAPPPPPPPPEPPPEPEAPKEPAPVARAPKAHKAPPAPAPAAAAQLRTIEENVKTADEPVRFVTDLNGTAFGYGTVARGGTGSGAPGAQLPQGLETPVTGAGGTGTAPELSRPPSLAESDPCRGFFPTKAQADRGEVQLKVRVEADGKVRSVNIAREAPSAQGFGSAARECLMSKRFSPALDKAGKPVAVVSPVTIRFSR